MRTRRKQLFGEELANSISHGIMAIFGIFVLVFLLVKSDTLSKTFGAIIFGLSVTALYTFSTLYHVWMNESFKNKILKRFDHISIYLLIGGTYAPILLNLTTITSIPSFIPNISVGLLFFIVQWLLIITGIVFKSIWLNKFHWIHVIIYLVLGWTAMFFIDKIYNYNVIFFWLIISGGLAYTFGVIFYSLSEKVKYFHFVWHLFVMAGTILHAIAIIKYIYV